MVVNNLRKLFLAVTALVAASTFGVVSGPADAIGPSQPACFGITAQLGRNAEAGDVAIVNLTPVSASAPGDGQLVPLELYKNPPKAANVNFAPNTVDPNVAFTRTGSKGSLCFINSQHADVELIADHLGTIAGKFFRFAQANGAPKRVMDTRSSTIIKPNQNRCFKVAGKPGDAAVVNLTPVKATSGGDGQLVSSDIKNKPPKAANVNFAPRTVDPNVAIAKIGKDNKVCFVNSKHASVHVVADHLGTIKATAYRSARKNGAPKRVLDTRDGARISPNGRRCFKVSGDIGDAAIVNLTPVKATGAGNGQLVSSKVEEPPTAANVNFAPGTVDPNVAIAAIGRDHKVCFINSKQAAVHVVADHLGTIKRDAYKTAEFDGEARRIADTRILAQVVPAKASGPRPVRPSQVLFACGYQYDSAEWQTIFWGMEGDGEHGIVLRYPNHPAPIEGKDYVRRFKVHWGLNASYSFPLPEEQAKVWNSQVVIETYTDDPALHSTAVFDIKATCVDGDIPIPLPGN